MKKADRNTRKRYCDAYCKIDRYRSKKARNWAKREAHKEIRRNGKETSIRD